MNRFVKGVFILLFLILFLPVGISAHGTGTSIPKDVDGFTIELEYDQKELLDREPVSFAFRLLDKKTGAGVHFDSVMVRFEKKDGRNSFLTSKIAEDDLIDGLARLTVTPMEGEYSVNLDFKQNDKTIAEENYDIAVTKAKESKAYKPDDLTIGLSLGGLLAGFVLGRLLFRKKS